ncbi:VOC family protein [Streptomyces sp. AJS327]|uniref:VOC family protein n=1 Tax=Streptomyces sp. AJS327 TaxID=2545265 RepID=UPI0015DFA3AD|nr:VOC family protein [Streptomyces sp. AJS327]MBA0051996.1 VOC family protein [Streptomyces sp. AJS327]
MTEAVTRQPHVPGTPCWASLVVRNLAGSQEFYRHLFGWEFRSGAGQPPPYVRAVSGGREVAGLWRRAPGRPGAVGWTPYLATGDADETAALVRESGGTVAVGPLAAEERGRMAIAADPQGAVFGLWQGPAGSGPPCPAHRGEGAPVWHELRVHEAPAAGKFYAAVFGHDVDDTAAGEPDCLTLRLAGSPVAAVRGPDAPPPAHGPHWTVYFGVSDLAAAVRRAREGGGAALDGPADSPVGRAATVADPEGARFRLVQRD